MKNYRFTLEPYKGPASRYICPGCNDKRKTFVRYIDTHTGHQIDKHVGRCSRIEKCSYHFTPKQWFAEQGKGGNSAFQRGGRRPGDASPRKEYATSFINAQVREQTQGHYDKNNFVQYLHTFLSEDTVARLCRTYHIGTSKRWPGANIFWQVDKQGHTRTGKIMLYNPATGKRVKEPYSHISWVHGLKGRAGQPLFPGFNLQQCLFGEHLLETDKEKWVALVESEKTAMIGSVFLPRYLWLATGSLNALSPERCRPLADRTVIVYPDLGSYDNWVEKSRRLFLHYTVSDVLETLATPDMRAIGGLDIADVLVG